MVSLRCRNDIPCYNAEVRRAEGWLNLSEAATFLGVAPGTLRVAVAKGDIVGEHPLADGPWVFRRQDLETEAARAVVERVRRRTGAPAEASAERGTHDFFGT